jgi:hypothetical protein
MYFFVKWWGGGQINCVCAQLWLAYEPDPVNTATTYEVEYPPLMWILPILL